MRLSIAAVITFCASVVGAETITCPQKIETKEELVTPKGEQWSPFFQEFPHQLMNVEFYEGDPQRKVQLVPDEIKKKKGKQVTAWKFGKEFKDQITLVCTYDRTNYALWMKLPMNVSKCVVTSDPEIRVAGVPKVERIECR